MEAKIQPPYTLTVEAFHANHGNPVHLLIDIREQEEWQAFHIPGVRHIPKDILLLHYETYLPNKETPVYLHCLKGMRSAFVAEALVQLGYKAVYTLEGGILNWAVKNYPVNANAPVA